MTGIFDEVAQDREGLWPKRNLVPVKKETAAIQIQDITIETQSLCLHLRLRVGIGSGHGSAAHFILINKRNQHQLNCRQYYPVVAKISLSTSALGQSLLIH